MPELRLSLYERQVRRGLDALPESPPPAGAQVRVHRARIPSRALPLLGVLGLGLERTLGRPDLLHLTDYAWLPPGRLPLVATIHDLLFFEHPECYTPGMLRGLPDMTTRLVGAAARVLVPSQATADALGRHFPAHADKVRVTPLAATPLPTNSARAARDQDSVPAAAPYVLSVGTLEPRKNLGRVIDALTRCRERHADLRLVVVGADGWLDGELRARIAATPWIERRVRVDRVTLAALYAEARCLAWPSLGEGFGLPILEAQAAGCPVLTSRGGACEETAGEGALRVDPTSVDEITQALLHLLDDERARAALAAAGRENAARFSWSETATRTHAAYAEVVAAHGRESAAS